MDLGFMAPPGEVQDWRRILLTDLASEVGLLDQLPATHDELAKRTGLHAKSARVILEALTAWDVVRRSNEMFVEGQEFPADSDRRLIRQHAQFLKRWTHELPERMSDPVNHQRQPRSADAVAEWLGSLGVRAQQHAPEVIEMCCESFPEARRVLDVAGGHGEYGIEASKRCLDVTMIDLPVVIESVGRWPRVRESGIELIAGDVFDADLAGPYDLVLCFGFTHTQPPERIGTLFPKLAEATATGGGIAINTFVRGTSDVASIFAVQMLVAGNDGDVHTFDQYSQWLTDAGYHRPGLVERDGRTLIVAKLGSAQSEQS